MFRPKYTLFRANNQVFVAFYDKNDEKIDFRHLRKQYSKTTKTACANCKFDKLNVLQRVLQLFTKMLFLVVFQFYAQNALFGANQEVVALFTRKMTENTSLCIFVQDIPK